MVHSTNKRFQLTLWQKIVSADFAGCSADLVTFPLDTVKVWLQVRGESAFSYKPIFKSLKKEHKCFKSFFASHAIAERHLKTIDKTLLNKQPHFSKKIFGTLSKNDRGFYQVIASRVDELAHQKNKAKHLNITPLSLQSALHGKNPGLVTTIVQGIRSNGFFSLYGGISAGLQRQATFCAVKIGLYDSVKTSYHKIFPGSPSGKQVSQRILAGTITAFVAVALFQPAEVVKIRMQAQTSKAASDRLYSSSIQAYRSIFKVGFREAWRGIETNAARLAVVNVCELVTYDVVKELLLDCKLMNDNPTCHFTSAFLSGFVTTVVASPIDVVKTRFVNATQGYYKDPLDCAKSMLIKEGFRAFLQRVHSAYLRLGSWNIVMFASYEQYKSLFHCYTRHHKGESRPEFIAR